MEGSPGSDQGDPAGREPDGWTMLGRPPGIKRRFEGEASLYGPRRDSLLAVAASGRQGGEQARLREDKRGEKEKAGRATASE